MNDAERKAALVAAREATERHANGLLLLELDMRRRVELQRLGDLAPGVLYPRALRGWREGRTFTRKQYETLRLDCDAQGIALTSAAFGREGDAMTEEEDDRSEWQSGQFCRHWSDPVDCDLLCVCGHKCCEHPAWDDDGCAVEGCACTAFVDSPEKATR